MTIEMCCGTCIGDPHLRRNFIPSRSTTTGLCPRCLSEGVHLVAPAELRDEFDRVLGIYREQADGILLHEVLRQDWAMFTHAQMDATKVQVLLDDILDDDTRAQRLFVPSELCQSDALDRWNTFRQELMYRNRFFPKSGIDLQRLRQWLSLLLVDKEEIPTAWCRARIQDGDATLEHEQMLAPPAKKASHGRANPAGIPYLYLASDVATAICEVRPQTGEAVTVATYSVPAGTLKLVDLTEPRRTVSPFAIEDQQAVAHLRGDVNFLERLGEDLTRPVVPGVAAAEYTPTQYLCEFVKECGYDGVRYRSSVGSGVNIALFDPTLATIGVRTTHRVTRVIVESGLVPPIE